MNIERGNLVRIWNYSKHDLMNIARTTLSSKILQGKKDYFAKLCVDAVLKLHVKFSVKLM